MRGLAALAVLVWHYQHFYYPVAGVGMSTEEALTQPFYEELSWLYTHGAYGVQLFWTISGFVFACRYVEGKYNGLRDFVVRRLARLYPLHLVTLLLVAILQAVSLISFGHYQIYPHNDVYHFILHLLLASHWGVEAGFSFNAPIWSVSVEVLVYAGFVLMLPLIKRGWWTSAPLAALALTLDHFTAVHIVVQCAAYFFGGIFIFGLLQRAPEQVSAIAAATLLLTSLLLIWGVGIQAPTVFLLCVAAVSTGASVDKIGGRALARCQWLGDMSYSLYLLHVPVQIAVLMLFSGGLVPRAVVASPAFFVGFFIGMIALSLLVYRFFEAPIRRAVVRRALLEKKPALPRAAF